jgi:hypothetical protein
MSRERVKILRTVGTAKTEVIEMDAVISHNIRYSASVTDHPVADGATISDHVRLDPTDISLTGVVTNTPVTLLAGGIIPTLDRSRSRSAYEALLEVYNGRELVQIEDGLDVFTDMLMYSLEVPRDRATYNALQFTASFRKIVKVGLKVVEISEDDQALAAESTDTGTQTPDEATPEQTSQASTLLQIFQGVGLAQ